MGLFDNLTRSFRNDIPSSPPGRDGNWELIEEVSDEFEGNSLDESKWEPFNKNWKGRAPGWFNPQNVTVNDGCLQLTSRREDPPAGFPDAFHTFSTSFVRSKAQIKYGYFEALVHPANSITSSAWWFVHNDRQTWNEIDVFELSQARGHERKFHMNAHVFRVNGTKLAKTLSHPRWVELDHKTSQKPFVVAMEWDKEYIQWLVDGKVVRRQRNDHWHDPMWVQFDCETMGNWFGLPNPNDQDLPLPATFKVLYVRAWRKL